MKIEWDYHKNNEKYIFSAKFGILLDDKYIYRIKYKSYHF